MLVDCKKSVLIFTSVICVVLQHVSLGMFIKAFNEYSVYWESHPHIYYLRWLIASSVVSIIMLLSSIGTLWSRRFYHVCNFASLFNVTFMTGTIIYIRIDNVKMEQGPFIMSCVSILLSVSNLVISMIEYCRKKDKVNAIAPSLSSECSESSASSSNLKLNIFTLTERKQ